MGRLATHVLGPAVGEGESVSRTGLARVLFGVAVGPLVGGYIVMASLLALVTATAGRTEFSLPGVLVAAGPAWLAAYQVPVRLAGQPLGVLPLLPTIAVGLLVARAAAAAVRRLGDLRPSATVPVVVAVLGAHAVLGSCVAVLATGTDVEAELPEAVLTPAVLSGLCSALGAAGFRTSGGPGRPAVRWSDRVDPIALSGLRAGLLGIMALLTAAALTFLLATACSAATAGAWFSAYAPDGGSALGLLLLSLGYLPNAVVLALGFVTGPGFSIGQVSVSPFSHAAGPVPAVPVLAGMPEQYAGWWPVLLVLPAAAGVLVGWSLRRIDPRPAARLRAVLVAGSLAGFGTVVLGAVAGGGLGGGVFDPVMLPVEFVSVAAFGWIAVFGGTAAWFGGPRG